MCTRKTVLVLTALTLSACGNNNPFAFISDAIADVVTGDDSPPASFVETCTQPAADFERGIYSEVMRTQCALCHQAGAIAGNTRFVIGDDLAAVSVAASALAAETIGARELPLLLAKPTGQVEHGGGPVLELGSEGHLALEHYVDAVRSGACETASAGCEANAASARLLRRLSKRELIRTVGDVLGVDASGYSALPTDVQVGLFQNDASLLADATFAEQLRISAEAIAKDTIAQRAATLFPCGESRDCVVTFLSTTGTRLFRRPLLNDEKARYLAVFDEVAAEDGFAEGVTWLLTAMLQAPALLYREELGARDDDGNFTLTAYERATLLSYSVWGTAPDAQLLAAANDSSLNDDAVFAGELERLKNDPRANDVWIEFFNEVMGTTRIDSVAHDSTTYPEWNAALIADMKAEVAAVVTYAVKEGLSLSQLLALDTTFASSSLAQFYGLSQTATVEPSNGLSSYTLADSGRQGLLSLGAFVATHAKPATSGPIQRGVAVRERIFCEELPPPPPNLNAQPPPVDPSLPTREQYAAHSAQAECRSCHVLIDGIGFGFEAFDGIGRVRANDGGAAVDASGEVVGTPSTDGTFDGIIGLNTKLAHSSDVSQCFGSNYFTSVFGVEPTETACDSEQVITTDDLLSAPLNSLPDRMLGLSHTLVRSGGDDDTNGPAADAIAESPFVPDEPDAPIGGGGDNDGVSNESGVAVTLREASRWDSGACYDGVGTNNTTAALAWSAVFSLEGTIDNVWNATATTLPSGEVRFAPAPGAFNTTVAAGETTTLFGFCESF